jgi:hypothetical protein
MNAQLLPVVFVAFLPAERELNVKIFFVAIVQVSCL